MARRKAFVVTALTAAAGCTPMAPPETPVATASLVNRNGAAIGTVRLFSEPTGALLRIDASGLPPGQHGVHLHMTGRCDAPGFTTAGGHWNPTQKQHGHLNPAGWHQGDLGNLGVGADGRLVAGLLVPEATLAQLHDADGTAIVFHANTDDERTDPSGNSGDRIACAVL